jgi:hypothetical protein
VADRLEGRQVARARRHAVWLGDGALELALVTSRHREAEFARELAEQSGRHTASKRIASRPSRSSTIPSSIRKSARRGSPQCDPREILGRAGK